MKMKERDIKITGMTCASCAKAIESTIKNLKGVESVSVNLATESAHIVYDPSKISLETIIEAIENIGYGVVKDEAVTVKIGGMRCAMCVRTIESVVSKLNGVKSVTVNLPAKSARMVFDPTITSLEDIKQAIESVGYEFIGTEDEEGEGDNITEMKKKLFFATIVGTILIILTYGRFIANIPYNNWIQLLLATPVMLYSGEDMFSSAVKALRNRMLNMDVMYSMGVGSAFIASILSTLNFLPANYLFFETSVLLLAFLLLGRTLEAIAKGKTSEAIKKLMSLQAKTAVVIRDGREIVVPIEDVKVGDVVLVKPGEKIPVDGVIIEGESYIDESMVTGESTPNLKKVGDEVIAATINKNGFLKIKATRVGKDTVFAQIIKLVKEAVSSKPPIQRLADRIVNYFIPTVLIIAVGSFIYWYFIADVSAIFAFTSLISVLVIACPCAFGLATPTALTVGMGKGAELGILIKHGDALEIARKVSIVVFDKTGTLTKGRPEVADVISFDCSETDVLKIAAIAEKRSEHPLAEAIVRKAEAEKIIVEEPEKFEIIAGSGVVVSFNGNRILVGNRKLMAENGIVVGEDVEKVLKELEMEAKTAILVALNDRIVGVIGIADTLKESAFEAIKTLQGMGKKVGMITGDNRRSAIAIAKKLGIDFVLAEVLPHQKAEEVKKLQKSGEVVAFVGDGINDAPALAQANLGIAIGSGTDVAIESGEIVLIRDDLRDVVAAIQLSEKTLNKIKQNIFWAMIYNSLLIPAAAGLLYPFFGIVFRPEWAGAAMAMSSVSVVTNSLLMKNYVPPVKRFER